MTDPENLARDKFQRLFEDETRKFSSVLLFIQKMLSDRQALVCCLHTSFAHYS